MPNRLWVLQLEPLSPTHYTSSTKQISIHPLINLKVLEQWRMLLKILMELLHLKPLGPKAVENASQKAPSKPSSYFKIPESNSFQHDSTSNAKIPTGMERKKKTRKGRMIPRWNVFGRPTYMQ